MNDSQTGRSDRAEKSPAEVDGDSVKLWVVWRQDDHGNRFEVSRGHGREEAAALVASFEAKGHKQTYWVELQG